MRSYHIDQVGSIITIFVFISGFVLQRAFIAGDVILSGDALVVMPPRELPEGFRTEENSTAYSSWMIRIMSSLAPIIFELRSLHDKSLLNPFAAD